MKRVIAVGVALAALWGAAIAEAWGGASITDVSCPEIHATLPPESGPWLVEAVQGVVTSPSQLAGKPVLLSVSVNGSSFPIVLGDFYTATNVQQTVTVVAGSAANLPDGFVYKIVSLVNCSAPVSGIGPQGVAGPAGPQGAPGLAGPPGIPTVPAPPTKPPTKHHRRHHHHRPCIVRLPNGTTFLCGTAPPTTGGNG